MEGEIINRVANSPLVTIDLEEYYHHGDRVEYDIAQNLFQGLILREKDFRAFVKEYDWGQYSGKNVNIISSADAIIPTWAYMLLVTKLEEYANMVIKGSSELLEFAIFKKAFEKIDLNELKDKPIVIKGCGELNISNAIYSELTRILKPIAKSIMYGEPCSTVPVFKKSRAPKN